MSFCGFNFCDSYPVQEYGTVQPIQLIALYMLVILHCRTPLFFVINSLLQRNSDRKIACARKVYIGVKDAIWHQLDVHAEAIISHASVMFRPHPSSIVFVTTNSTTKQQKNSTP